MEATIAVPKEASNDFTPDWEQAAVGTVTVETDPRLDHLDALKYNAWEHFHECRDALLKIDIELGAALKDGASDEAIAELENKEQDASWKVSLAEKRYRELVDELNSAQRNSPETKQVSFLIAARKALKKPNTSPMVLGRADSGDHSRQAGSPTAKRRGSSRSSSRGGDSGDGPSDSDPPGLRPGSGGEAKKGQRLCLGCGGELVGRRPQTKYHDDACRKRFTRNGSVPVERKSDRVNWHHAVERVRLESLNWPRTKRTAFILAVIEAVESRRVEALRSPKTVADFERRAQYLDDLGHLLNGDAGRGADRPVQFGLWDLLRWERRFVDPGYPMGNRHRRSMDDGGMAA